MSDFIDLVPPAGGAKAANAFGIFAKQWAYEIPGAGTATGQRPTFRIAPVGIQLLTEHVPDFQNAQVLELGPHEGEHSVHLNALPVQHVYAVEGRPANFLKCLIVKNHLGLGRVRFGLGDFVAYLEDTQKVWDVVYCCGVLYHMQDPAKVLDLISKRCRTLILTTVVFDVEKMREADERTASGRFPTNWLRDINREGKVNGKYTYHERVFPNTPGHAILGHGSSHSAVANIVTAETLRQIVDDCGGTALHWKVTTNEREPSVEAAIRFGG